MTKNIDFLKICQKCGAKCCKMGGSTFTKKEMNLVLKAGYKNNFFKVKKGFYEVKSKKGICSYLNKDGSCKIQEAKPLLCLCWPVLPDFKGKKKGYVIVDCPLTSKLSKIEIVKCKIEANKVSKKIFDVALDFSTLNKKDAILVENRFNKFAKRHFKSSK